MRVFLLAGFSSRLGDHCRYHAKTTGIVKHQPDFSNTFFQTFGGAPTPVSYEIREIGFLHDIAFLTALTHDARLLNPNAEPENGGLTLRLNRDCWEYGFTRIQQSQELHIADTLIQLGGVVSCAWEIGELKTDEPWIDYTWICREFRDHDSKTFKFLTVGENWRLDVVMDREEWSIKLDDQETPHLWSAKNA